MLGTDLYHRWTVAELRGIKFGCWSRSKPRISVQLWGTVFASVRLNQSAGSHPQVSSVLKVVVVLVCRSKVNIFLKEISGRYETLCSVQKMLQTTKSNYLYTAEREVQSGGGTLGFSLTYSSTRGATRQHTGQLEG